MMSTNVCQWCGTTELFLLNDTYCPNNCTGPKVEAPQGLQPGNLSVVAGGQGLGTVAVGNTGVFGYRAKRAQAICRALTTGAGSATLFTELRTLCPTLIGISLHASVVHPNVKRLELELAKGKLPNSLPLGVRYHASRIIAKGANGGHFCVQGRRKPLSKVS